MFASRSDLLVQTKTRPWIAAVSFLILMFAALLVHAPRAQGATSAARNRAKAVADSIARAGSRDEGISVRVIEDGKHTVSRRARSHHATTKVTDEDTESSDTTNTPGAPEPPEPPNHGDNDLVRFGQDIEISPGQVIDGSVVAIGGSIVVRGRVKGDCTAVGGSVSVRDQGVVEGDAVSVGGSTTTADSAHVGGSNVSVGGWPHGSHAARMLPFLGLLGLGGLAITGIFTTIVRFLLTVFFAWLALMVARERMVHAVDRIGSDFWRSLLWGLAGWMAMIMAIPTIAVVCAIAIVILVITIIGIPVAILLAIMMVFALIAAVLGILIAAFLAYLNGAMYLGRRIIARRSPGVALSPLRAIVVGALVMLGIKLMGGLLGMIGVVFVMPLGIAFAIMAGVLLVIFTTAGLGAMILTRFSAGAGSGALAGAGAQPVPAGTGWYSPPPPPPPPPLGPEPPPTGGSSDAP